MVPKDLLLGYNSQPRANWRSLVVRNWSIKLDKKQQFPLDPSKSLCQGGWIDGARSCALWLARCARSESFHWPAFTGEGSIWYWAGKWTWVPQLFDQCELCGSTNHAAVVSHLFHKLVSLLIFFAVPSKNPGKQQAACCQKCFICNNVFPCVSRVWKTECSKSVMSWGPEWMSWWKSPNWIGMIWGDFDQCCRKWSPSCLAPAYATWWAKWKKLRGKRKAMMSPWLINKSVCWVDFVPLMSCRGH